MTMIPLRFLLGSLLALVTFASLLPAQQRKLESLADEFDLRWRVERAEAESIATALGMPIRSIAPDGTVRELKRFLNGSPMYNKTDNVNSSKTISTDKVYPGGGAGYNLTGSGIVLGEWDGGGVRTTHQEFGGRVLNSQGANNFHSTHVAGTMIASGASPAARGMSYAAQLRAFDWNSDNAEMASEAAAGLRTSNHSYGIITGWDYNYFNDNRWAWFGNPSISAVEDYKFGLYDQEAQDWDAVAHAAPYYLIVKSAGNDRDEGPGSTVNHWVFNGGWTLVTAARNRDGNSGYDCLSAASVAKNLLLVGAVNDISGGYSTPAGVVMSSFSAWGPTDDGRIKPDVVANGVSLYSSLETSNTAYGNLSGTSMASPSVTGSIGLLLQHQMNLHGGDSILASTMKGIIIHTADEAGTTPGPDYRFGWGLMNTRKAADLMTLDSADGPGSHIREYDISTGDTVTIDFASTGDEPLRATIAWNDIPVGLPPAVVDPPNLVLRNDIDMRITRKSDGAVFYPWTLDGTAPANAATTGDNNRDNVEQILIDAPGRTLYTLQLTHKTTIFNPPTQVSLIMSGNIETLGAALSTSPDTVSYSKVPGEAFSDSIIVYNGGDSVLAASVTKDLSSFWLSVTEDTVTIPSLDSATIHFDVDGALWSQWSPYGGSITFESNDVNANPLVVPVLVNVLGPTIVSTPGSFLIDLDSAEVGYDTIVVRNTGFIALDVVVADSAGALPSWITADPDTLTIPAGDSAAVALTTNALDEPLGDYYTLLKVASNDSATGDVFIPIYLNIGTRTLVSIDVAGKWNLVSIPVEPITGVKTVLFPSATTPAFGFDDGYYQEDTLRNGPGYWLKFGAPGSYDVDGYSYQTDTIPLATGWNLIGSIFEPISTGAVTTDPSGILTSDFYRYENGYQVADSIAPGKGYWVQSSQAGDLYLTTLPAAAPRVAAGTTAPDYNSITVTDGASGSRTLYFSAGGTAPAKTALPPKPPAGAFDARFGDETSFASFPPDPVGEESRTIVIASDATELRLTVRIRKSDGTRWFVKDASGESRALTDGVTLTIAPSQDGSTTIRLVAGGGNIPTEFGLDQNYPNPFNPSTKVSFAVPVEGMVNIRLYNILGNEVATLVSRRYEAGRHDVEFNAAALPSGVYIYTMRAGTFSQSRKMVLMR